MRAVRVSDPATVDVVKVPRPPAGTGEVLVRVSAAAVCPTDRRLAARGADPPRIPGHEAAGRLEDGTPVGVHPDIGCGRCPLCRAGWENRCPDRISIGLDRDGGFADWVAVPGRHVVPLAGVGPGVGPLLEPLACVLHALRLLGVGSRERIVVVGAGAMGILATWALQAAGAAVAVVQRSEPRRRLAAELGADAALGPDGDPAEALGDLPAAAIVAAPGAEALTWALERVAPGGRVHAFAGTPEGAPVDANLVHYRHLALVGSTGSTVADYERARELAASGAVPLDRLPIATVPLESVPGVLLGSPGSDVLKVLVDVEGAAM
ncbi:MAG: zinc-dependent alcohol dehydrogenase [Actinomycetota bacterium]